MSGEVNYWVITSMEEAFGPYDTYEAAYFFATMNLEPDTWTINHT